MKQYRFKSSKIYMFSNVEDFLNLHGKAGYRLKKLDQKDGYWFVILQKEIEEHDPI